MKQLNNREITGLLCAKIQTTEIRDSDAADRHRLKTPGVMRHSLFTN
jgi:hypothetical protein